LWSIEGHIWSEHAITEGLAVWKVGACHAVVAVVTVLGIVVNMERSARRLALLTIGMCMRLGEEHHFHFRLGEVYIDSEVVVYWCLITDVSSCSKGMWMWVGANRLGPLQTPPRAILWKLTTLTYW